jgi:hypothetical protein
MAQDVEVVELCDIQADTTSVPFLRQYKYNVATGALLTVTDTQLNGTTAYVVTGTPEPCVGEDAAAAPITLTTRNRTLQGAGAGAQWTPADVAGTLVSLTWVVMTGAAVAQDSAGTNARAIAGFGGTWSAEDANEILPPTSITIEVGATALVTWTER